MALAAVSFPAGELDDLARGLIDLKKRFMPSWKTGCPRPFDWITRELKGSDLRRDAAESARRKWRHPTGVLGGGLDLIRRHRGSAFGHVYVLLPGHENDRMAMYARSVQKLCGQFQRHLERLGEEGVVVLDSRTPGQNVGVCHSIFTQQHRRRGRTYGRLVELPLFGHSSNHAGLQVADLLTSGLIFPFAIDAYCAGRIENIHVRPG